MIVCATAFKLAIVCAITHVTQCQTTVEELQAQLDDVTDRLDEMMVTVRDLARQTMIQAYTSEEKVRSDGDSGIKLVRGNDKGPENYYASSHMSARSFMSVHDHANYHRTIGLGEMVVVLNGVEFRTRHNDYKLTMPSQTSTDYHATQPIPFPEVPKAVTELETVKEQIDEMRLWFKAFKDGDHSVRDYRPHFKAVMCYLEGTWTMDEDLEEPFDSERHHLDASTWFEMQEKIRYASYTGTKSRQENFAFLPTTIISVNQTTGVPNYAQWNYRVTCHPVEEHIPLSYLKQAEDLSYRYPRRKDLEDLYYSRAARFNLYEYSTPRFTKYSLIDRIFANIPGMDNIPDELRENAFGEKMYKFDENKELNAGYYHRWFKFSKPGAMGLTTVSRGFNDANMWVAMTTQNRVAPMSLQVCTKEKKWKKNSPEVCETHNTRFSFAIPLEIVFMTPLLSWNPYNLTIKKGADEGEKTGSLDKPYNWVDASHYCLTPYGFFSGNSTEDEADPADTGKSTVFVLDQDGVPRSTVMSGTRIVLRSIDGVGKIRLRFPITPVYGEGSSVWKELNALRDWVYERQGEKKEEIEVDELPEIFEFQLQVTHKPTTHYHTFYLPRQDYLDLIDNTGLQVRVTTDVGAGHTHDLTIRWSKNRGFEYAKCDDEKLCWDKHKKKLLLVRDT